MKNQERLQNHPELQAALAQLTQFIDTGDALHAADRILAVEDYISWQVLSELHRLPEGGKDFTKQVQLFIDLDAHGDDWAQIHNATVHQLSGSKDIDAIRRIFADVMEQTDYFLDSHIYPVQMVEVVDAPSVKNDSSAGSAQAGYAGDSWSDNLSGGGAAYQEAPKQSTTARSWQEEVRDSTAYRNANRAYSSGYKTSRAYQEGYKAAEEERYRRTREWRDSLREKERKENEERRNNTTGFVLAAVGAFLAFTLFPARAWLVIIGIGALFRILRKK